MRVNDLVDKIIEELYDRKGFDDWWDDIDEEIQNDIKESLEEIVEEYNQGLDLF